MQGRSLPPGATLLLVLLLAAAAAPLPASARPLPQRGAPGALVAPADDLHPAEAAQNQRDTDKVFYIFGYGSLLNRASTQRTQCGLSGIGEGTLAGLEVGSERQSTENSTQPVDVTQRTKLRCWAMFLQIKGYQ